MNYEKWFKRNEKNLEELFNDFKDDTCHALGKNIKFNDFKKSMKDITFTYYDKAYEIFKEETYKKYK